MFKNTHTHAKAYIEATQPNTLRWQLYYKGKTKFASQTHIIKCRDFFNDVVAKKHGKEFCIYGFTNANLKFNKEGLYILLTNTTKDWLENATAVLSPEMEKTWGIPFTVSEHPEGMLMLVPNQVLEHTYTMSLFTLILRLCNYNVKVSSFEDCFVPNGPLVTDNAVAFTRVPAILKNRLLPPEPTRGYWWYYNNIYNSKKETQDIGIVHNNGVSNWLSNFLKV